MKRRLKRLIPGFRCIKELGEAVDSESIRLSLSGLSRVCSGKAGSTMPIEN